MADNVTLTNTKTSFDADTNADFTSASDDVSGVQYQRIKVDLGADGAASPLVRGQQTTANSIPVALPSDQTVPVSNSGITTIAGAVSGTEMQVDVLTMPTTAVSQSGTWTVQPGNTANTTAWKVDGSAVTQPVSGTVTANAGSGTFTISGAVTNAGTFVTQENGAALTSLQLIDDAVTTLGTDTYTEATSKGITLGAVRRDADTTLVNTTNEFSPLQVDANGRLKVEAFSGETLPVSLTSTTITGTVAVTQSGTWDEIGINDSNNSITVDNGGTFAVQVDGSALTSLQLIDDAIATTASAITSKGMAVSGTDGTNARVIKTDSSGELQVDVLTMPTTTVTGTVAATQSGTWTEANSAAIAASLSVVDDWDNGASDGASISGDVAHDTADAGEPVKIGAKAIAHGTNPTAVTADDRTNLYANRAGILFTIGGHPNVICKNLNVTDGDGAQTDTALVTVSSGTKIVVTHVTVTADNANTGDVAVRIGFGTANTPSADAAGIILAHAGVPKGSGVSVGNGAGIIGIGADNEDLRLTCEDPAGGAIDIVVGYFTIES